MMMTLERPGILEFNQDIKKRGDLKVSPFLFKM